jgi:capsular polysaccharide transport system permease protein
MLHQRLTIPVEDADLGRSAQAPLPAARGWASRIPWMFTIMVVIPTLVAAIYFLLVAAPIYVSEAQFVASTKNGGPQTSGGLGSVLATVGVSAGQEQVSAYEVQSYMTSRNAIADLAQTANLLKVVDRPEGDVLYRFPRPFERASIENLYNGYRRFVTVEYNLQTGISTLKVRAFRPQDAQRIANALLDRSETWVSKLNDRALADTLAQSQRQVDDAEARLAKAQAALANYRTSQRLIDPDKSAAANVELLGRLEAQAAALRAQRNALAASAPQSPQLPILDQQITAFQAQIDGERARAAGETGSLAPQVTTFEELSLERELAAKSLEMASAGLENARLEARRQQVFIDRVVNPSLPDKAEEPHRLKMIGLILLSCLIAYSIAALFIAGLREHQQR